MPVDLNAMALFARVVENKSFSEAAKRAGIPISTVSRKVSELERSLGVRLIERTTRKLRLTELGRQYYDYCRRGLEEFEAGTHLIQDKQTELAGTLRISAPPNLVDSLVAPLVCEFLKQYPKVTIKVFISERNLDLIEDGLDMTFRVGPLHDSNLIAHTLIEYRHLLVASKAYLDKQGELQHPKELQEHRLITFGGWHEHVIWILSNQDEMEKIRVPATLSFNDYAGIIHALRQDLGIAEVPSIIIAPLLQSGDLTEVLPEWLLPPTKLSIVYPGSRNIPRSARRFIDFSLEYIRTAFQ